VTAVFEGAHEVPMVGHGGTVYRLFQGGELIYIGKTTNLHARVGQHTGHKAFPKRVDWVEWEWFDELVAAERRETELIVARQPRLNIVGIR
jgi:excinuclease UvrABC nuclease subunit